MPAFAGVTREAGNPPAAPKVLRLGTMPRYFFNVRGDDFEEEDMVGRTCCNDVAAPAEALDEAGRVLRRRLGEGAISDRGAIEVEDERHRTILTLPLRAASY